MSTSETTPQSPSAVPERQGPLLPLRTQWQILFRLYAVQGSWNYELLSGTGIGFCIEPALRRLPGGLGGVAYREALARHCQYFNCHPYLAGVAVGALARAELEGEAPARIDRFRTALCGPLGSLGDRLVWAAWLPFCSILGLAAFAANASWWVVIAIFAGTYNAGHLALRAWGLRAGLAGGLHVSQRLGTPWLRDGPEWLSRSGALLGGLILPHALFRLMGPGRTLLWTVLAAVGLGGFLLTRLHGRLEGWRLALVVLAAVALFSLVR